MDSSMVISILLLAVPFDVVNEPIADVLRGIVNRLNALAIVEPTSILVFFFFFSLALSSRLNTCVSSKSNI